MATIEVTTDRAVEARDITPAVAAALPGAGYAWLSTPHTTCALLLSEVDDELLADLERTAVGLLAPLEPYTHARKGNPNARAHLCSSLFGTQLVLRVRDGRPVLGTYQRIVLLELDGPRTRRLDVEPLPGGTP